MKKIFKSGLSLLLALTFVLSSAYVGLSKVELGKNFAVKAGATSKTSNDAISWCQSQLGKSLDYDGNGYWCVDLIAKYYQYLGAPTPGGNACDYATNSLPSGWTRTKGGVPRKGDIIVWAGGSGAGHIAIYESDYVTYHQRYSGQYVEKVTKYYKDIKAYDGAGYWGCIHPNFSDSASLVTPTISFNKSSYTIGDTIVVSWKPSPSNSNLSHYWISVYDSDDYMIINQSIDKSKTSISFSIPKVGTYKVKIYATPIGSVSGEGSLTDTKSFTVNPKPVTYSITYNANRGSGAPAAQTKTHGVTLTLSSTKPTRSGYTFLGWSTSSSATSATYSAGGSFNINANTTLYAVWKQNIVKCSNPTMKTISNKVTGVSVEWNSVSGADSYYVYRQVGSGSWSLIASGVTKCSYLDTSVVSGTVYKYKVRAYNKAGLSDDHNNYRTIKFLSVPKVSKVTNLVSGLKVQWNAVPGATKYYIHRRGANGNFEYITATTSTTFVDTEVKNKNGYVYWYTIKSSDGTDVSSYYAAGSPNLIKAKRLSAPKISSLKNTTSGIEVKWNKIGGAKGYNVYRKTSSSGWKLIAKVTTTKYVDKSVKSSSGKIYQYTIRATYDSYISSYYDANSVNTPKIKRLLTPDVLSATSYKSGIQVKWKSVKGASGYYVYRKTTGGWQKIATVKGSAKYLYTDKTAKKGTTYTYTVKAYSGSYTSGYESGVKCKDKY